MPVAYVSVKEAGERYGYSGSHLRNLLAKGVIEGEKFTYVWMVDPKSVEKHKARMDRLGRKKHGVWANAVDEDDPTPPEAARRSQC